MLEERGFPETGVDEVSRRAGVSHGTFYTHFESKEALLREVAHTVVGEMLAAILLGPGISSDPYERIYATNRQYLASWRRCSRIIRMVDQMSGAGEEYRQLMIEMREVFVSRGAEGIRKLQDARLADPALNPRLTAVALGAMVEQVAHVWLDLGEEFAEEEVVDHLTRLWAGAIGLKVPSNHSVSE
ncbi:hypothetical protein AU252_00830 [Pseudarthrobacter sulfonivorans]|uniref:HTH tetR-type domain-containing protein n=1 Tax=Pseudarthrobacter sulfonivorans TaxID=121292 RepID=A0A0U3Q6G7_9MICC|nr:hypothetical protein AU252_00830 [Pseudarthrobacter sulfonivorans]